MLFKLTHLIDYVQSILDGSTAGRYLRGWVFERSHPELLEDVEVPAFASDFNFGFSRVLMLSPFLFVSFSF